MVYNIRYWDNGTSDDGEDYRAKDLHSQHLNWRIAKMVCRRLGHTGEDNPGLAGYPPIAYVSTDEGEGERCWYTPKFRKGDVSSNVSQRNVAG